MDLAKTLSYNYIFRGLSKGVINGLAGSAIITNFRGGDTLIRQFDHKSDLILILEGEALIRSFSGELLSEIGPGSIIGEIALIDEQPRSATVVAKGDMVGAVFHADAFRGMLDTDPKTAAVIYGNLARVLCRRLRSMNVQLDGLGREA
jgi:CRP/FNR family cyclic AMP-dependent transcriptional regulator